jgi:hypothetical protein
MRDDRIFTLQEYKNYLIDNEYSEELTARIVSLKVKHTVIGVLGKDDRPASKKKMVVHDLIEHLSKCLSIQ